MDTMESPLLEENTIVRDEVNKMLTSIEEENKKYQKSKGFVVCGGIDIQQMLGLLETLTNKYWIYLIEEDMFEHHTLEEIEKFSEKDLPYRYSHEVVKTFNIQ